MKNKSKRELKKSNLELALEMVAEITKIEAQKIEAGFKSGIINLSLLLKDSDIRH